MEEDEYKKMYLHLFQETQKAIDLLQKAHTDCEELFLAQGDEEENRHSEE